MDGAPPAAEPEPPYDGPLFVRATNSGTDWAARSGAAGRALRCAGEIYKGYTDGEIPSYGGGAEPQAALQAFLNVGPGSVPETGYRLVRREGDRALFTYDVDGRAKVALTAVKRTKEVSSFGEPIDRDRDRVDCPGPARRGRSATPRSSPPPRTPSTASASGPTRTATGYPPVTCRPRRPTRTAGPARCCSACGGRARRTCGTRRARTARACCRPPTSSGPRCRPTPSTRAGCAGTGTCGSTQTTAPRTSSCPTAWSNGPRSSSH